MTVWVWAPTLGSSPVTGVSLSGGAAPRMGLVTPEVPWRLCVQAGKGTSKDALLHLRFLTCLWGTTGSMTAGRYSRFSSGSLLGDGHTVPRKAAALCSPTGSAERSRCSAFSPAPGDVGVVSTGVKQYLLVIICISLKTYGEEHLFISSVAICVHLCVFPGGVC